MHDERESLRRRIEGLRESLLLIEEREAEYTFTRDVPLDYVREKREKEAELDELERRLLRLSSDRPAALRALTEEERGQIKLALLESACLEEPEDCQAVIERLPFAAGVDCGGRQHERVARVLEVCLEQPDGLEELVAALASTSGDEAGARLRP